MLRDCFWRVHRFEGFQASLGVARHVLADRLRKLVRQGVVRPRGRLWKSAHRYLPGAKRTGGTLEIFTFGPPAGTTPNNAPIAGTAGASTASFPAASLFPENKADITGSKPNLTGTEVAGTLRISTTEAGRLRLRALSEGLLVAVRGDDQERANGHNMASWMTTNQFSPIQG